MRSTGTVILSSLRFLTSKRLFLLLGHFVHMLHDHRAFVGNSEKHHLTVVFLQGFQILKAQNGIGNPKVAGEQLHVGNDIAFGHGHDACQWLQVGRRTVECINLVIGDDNFVFIAHGDDQFVLWHSPDSRHACGFVRGYPSPDC